jgi:hypothetical protein
MLRKDNTPGKYPTCIIGAGFPLAILQSKDHSPKLLSTSTIIEETATNHGDLFPIIHTLYEKILKPTNEFASSNSTLNNVWSNRNIYLPLLLNCSGEIIEKYRHNLLPKRQYIEKLAYYLINTRNIVDCIFILFETELKRMITLHFSSDKTTLKNNDSAIDNLKQFINYNVNNFTWISLNYDLALESFLQKHCSNTWEYCFHKLIGDTNNSKSPNHIIIKPHGSLNVWFSTKWNNHFRHFDNQHFLYYNDETDLLKTCKEDDIGLLDPNLCIERRPWLIGYLPDFLKDELNSPGCYADSAHDMSKYNLAYASFSLNKATSIYILGYSMPPEDEWILNRILNIEKKEIPIYIASGNNSQKIVDRFKYWGFPNAMYLTNNNFI